MKSFSKKTLVIVSCMISVFFSACGKDVGNNPTLKENTPLSSSAMTYNMSSSVKEDAEPPSNGIVYGTYTFDAGTITKTVTIPEGTTYMITGFDYCPSGWHKMTIEECQMLYVYRSELDPVVFADSFSVSADISTTDHYRYASVCSSRYPCIRVEGSVTRSISVLNKRCVKDGLMSSGYCGIIKHNCRVNDFKKGKEEISKNDFCYCNTPFFPE